LLIVRTSQVELPEHLLETFKPSNNAVEDQNKKCLKRKLYFLLKFGVFICLNFYFLLAVPGHALLWLIPVKWKRKK
jgi:hypothetical protein